jgi:hypothetical protein
MNRRSRQALKLRAIFSLRPSRHARGRERFPLTDRSFSPISRDDPDTSSRCQRLSWTSEELTSHRSLATRNGNDVVSLAW